METGLGSPFDSKPPNHNLLPNISESLLILCLCGQFVFYFSLNYIIHFFAFQPHLPSSSSKTNLLHPTAIEAQLTQRSTTRRLHFTLERAAILGVLGPSECGKSQLLSFLMRSNTRAYSGSLEVLAEDFTTSKPKRWKYVGGLLEEGSGLGEGVLFHLLFSVGRRKGLQDLEIHRELSFLAMVMDLREHLFKKYS